jgi:predicted transposase YbfD/YdcC
METNIMHHFSTLEDPRIDRQKHHSLSEILFLILCCSLCGITDYVHIEDFGNAHKDWFRKYFRYSEIPSHDTLGRVMRLLSPSAFKECFVNWVSSLGCIKDDLISIDGKNLRHSFDNGDVKSSIYMVSAWGSNTGLVLGQEKVATKSNEITAIPKLLEVLDIKGCIITIDAMGCQYEIANKIKDNGGDYIFSLKGNQGNLSKDVELFFEDKALVSESNPNVYETVDGDHGRIETRKCTVITDAAWLVKRHKKWGSIKSLIRIESKREINGKISEEKRYYISSIQGDAKMMLHCIRSHWGIENKLHWVLDVQFNEDMCRIRKDHAPENMAIVRHMAINFINKFKTDTKSSISIKRIQNKAAWSDEVRQAILF